MLATQEKKVESYLHEDQHALSVRRAIIPLLGDYSLYALS